MGDINLEQLNEQVALEKKSAEQIPPTEQITREQAKELLPEKEGPRETAPTETDKPRLRLPSFKKTRPALVNPKDTITVQIENIMQDGLTEAYQQLSPIAQQEFKIKGEETASAIREILNSAHIKVKKIFRLIYEWLHILPGVNRFFLEQEAKIKTDKIIAVKKEQDKMKIEQI